MGIDSEDLLFAKLLYYAAEMPGLISRRHYDDRRKLTSGLCDAIRGRMAEEMDTAGLFARIIGEIRVFTAMQYINHISDRLLGRVKYALA